MAKLGRKSYLELKSNILLIALVKILECKRSILPSNIYGSGVVQENEELLPQGFESFPSDLLQTRWPNLVHVEYLQMVKPVVVGFCCIGS